MKKSHHIGRRRFLKAVPAAVAAGTTLPTATLVASGFSRTSAPIAFQGAWYAVADASDRHHDAARRFYLTNAPQAGFFTTDLIVAETFALISSHLGRPAALTFWRPADDAHAHPVRRANAFDIDGGYLGMQSSWATPRTVPKLNLD